MNIITNLTAIQSIKEKIMITPIQQIFYLKLTEIFTPGSTTFTAERSQLTAVQIVSQG